MCIAGGCDRSRQVRDSESDFSRMSDGFMKMTKNDRDQGTGIRMCERYSGNPSLDFRADAIQVRFKTNTVPSPDR